MGQGVCVIFNNEFFTHPSFKTRSGTEVDARYIEQVFRSLDFQIECHNNLTSDQMHRQFQLLQNHDYTNNYCLFIFILSHGHLEGVYGTDGGDIAIEHIQRMFSTANCPSLKDKPKVFVIQCCRLPVNLESCEPIVIEEDMLLAYPCQPHCEAYRYPQSGSPFIQSVMEQIQKWSRHEDVLSILTMVSKDTRHGLLYKLFLMR